MIAAHAGPAARWACCWSGWAVMRPGCSGRAAAARGVQGRVAAGARAERGRGPSQQRIARRREKQAAEALAAAADAAAGVFGRYGGPLDALVLGGDRRAVAGLRDDPRLRGYFSVAVERFLTVPDPRLAVLRETPRKFRAIRVQLAEPARRTPGASSR